MTEKQKFLITTAINYTNGSPHIGHCYEAIITDFIARAKRIQGRDDVFFQTGTDEHGLKIAKTAESRGIKPIELCDQYAAEFEDLANELLIDYDNFIRTTNPDHQIEVQEIFQTLLKSDLIYLGEYEGWYRVREETFISELDAKLMNYQDPLTGKPLTKIKEPSYFFRLSQYQEKLIQHINENPEFIYPASHRNQILARLKKDPLQDLSISRTNFNWGIPVPEDPKHCLYVWLDALFNYYTGPPKEFWPANIHVIGKDIVWFHSVIWPSLLLGMNLDLPKQILVHQFVTADDGRKMSKSLGNVVDFNKLFHKYPVSSFRYYLLKELSWESDLRFSEQRLEMAHDTELADKFGNLVNRVFSLSRKYNQDLISNQLAEPIFDIQKVKLDLNQIIDQNNISSYVFYVNNLIQQVNAAVNDQKIWNIGKPEDSRTRPDLLKLLRGYQESLVIIAILWFPIQPDISQKIFSCFYDQQEPIPNLETMTWNQLKPNTKINKFNGVLFKKYQPKAAKNFNKSKQTK